MQTHLSPRHAHISSYIYIYIYIYVILYNKWCIQYIYIYIIMVSHGSIFTILDLLNQPWLREPVLCCFGFPSKSCKASGQADASPKVCITRLRSTGPSSMGRTVDGAPERAPDCTSYQIPGLVNIQKTDGKIMENHHFYWVNPFSIANCECLPKGMIFLWLNSLVYGRYNMM